MLCIVKPNVIKVFKSRKTKKQKYKMIETYNKYYNNNNNNKQLRKSHCPGAHLHWAA